MSIARPDYPTTNPGEAKFYGMDFVNYLMPGDSIVSATVTLTVITGTDPNPQDHVGDAIGIVDAKVSALLSFLVAGCYYIVLFTALTAAGETLELYSRVRCDTPN
jgi:hypothetical protein